MPPKANHKYDVGDLVFAKVKGYPPWPARIESEPPAGYKAGPGRYPVFFFGTYESAVVSARDLSPYEQNKHKLGTPRKIKNFNEGLKEIEENPQIQVIMSAEALPTESQEEPPEDTGGQSLDEAEDDGPTDEKPVEDSEKSPKADSPPVLKEEEPINNSNAQEVNPSAEQQAIDSDSDDDEERKLVIDDQVTNKRKKKESAPVKKKQKTSDKSAPSSGHSSKKKPTEKTSQSPRTKRKRVSVLEDSSDSEAEKPKEKSADIKAAPKDSDSDDVKTKPKDINSSDEKSSAEDEKKSRKRKKEKSKSKSKDVKKHKKEHKSKDKSESEPKTTAVEESAAEDPEVVEKLKIKLQEKDKEKEIQQKLQEKEKEKERRKQEKKEQKRKEKLEKSAKVAPPITEVLTTIDNDIKDALSVNNANIDRCLEAMERLKTVPITPQGLEEYGTQLKAVIQTLKKCRKYKTDERVRQKSDHLYHKFRDFFYTNDTQDLSDTLAPTANPGAESSESNEQKDESQVLSTESKTTENEEKSSPPKSTESTTPEVKTEVCAEVKTTEQNTNNVKNGLSAKEEDIKTDSELKSETNSTEVPEKKLTEEKSGAQPISEKMSAPEVPNGLKVEGPTDEANKLTTNTTPESTT